MHGCTNAAVPWMALSGQLLYLNVTVFFAKLTSVIWLLWKNPVAIYSAVLKRISFALPSIGWKKTWKPFANFSFKVLYSSSVIIPCPFRCFKNADLRKQDANLPAQRQDVAIKPAQT